jgi:hypothetical protein
MACSLQQSNPTQQQTCLDFYISRRITEIVRLYSTVIMLIVKLVGAWHRVPGFLYSRPNWVPQGEILRGNGEIRRGEAK